MMRWVIENFDKIFLMIGLVVYIWKSISKKELGYIIQSDLDKEYMKTSEMYKTFLKAEDWRQICNMNHGHVNETTARIEKKLDQIVNMLIEVKK